MSFTAHSVQGVAILLWAAQPEAPHRLATPFFCAAAAAAMDVPVEIYFSARSVHLLVPGVAAQLRAGDHPNTVWDAMHVALAQGVRMFACTDALAAQGLAQTALIAQCSGHGGVVQFMARACDTRWQSLVF